MIGGDEPVKLDQARNRKRRRRELAARRRGIPQQEEVMPDYWQRA